MMKLRAVLAANIKAYRAELGLSQIKLADLIDAAPNYIAMIESERRFPTDTMLEKIAFALKREPVELFALEPLKMDWQEHLIAELAGFINEKLRNVREAACKEAG